VLQQLHPECMSASAEGLREAACSHNLMRMRGPKREDMHSITCSAGAPAARIHGSAACCTLHVACDAADVAYMLPMQLRGRRSGGPCPAEI
jgi:hypothetical protein